MKRTLIQQASLSLGVVVAGALAFGATPAMAQTVKMAVPTFLTGAGAPAFGLPGKNGVELIVRGINNGELPAPYNQKGFAGRQIELNIYDESGGGTKQVTELRNKVQKQKVDLVVGYISSGTCAAVTRVAEELKILTVLAVCGTPRVFELAGDEFQLDARVLKWRAWANLLGFDALFRLERLSGRYRDIADERDSPRSVVALDDIEPGVNAFALARRIPDWARPVDARYGSATYVPMADRATYDIAMTQSGLIARPANAAARAPVISATASAANHRRTGLFVITTVVNVLSCSESGQSGQDGRQWRHEPEYPRQRGTGTECRRQPVDRRYVRFAD